MSRAHQINDLQDPRLAPYRELKKTNFTRWAPYFIAEGRLVTIRLIESQFELESVLIAESKLESMKPYLCESFETLIVPDPLVNQLVGFQFHAGVMGCGRRNKITSLDGLETMRRSRLTLVALPETSLPDNLGSLIRISAAFGCDGIVLGQRSADAFSRRVIRVSMGNVFSIPIFEPECFDSAIQQLRHRLNIELIASSLDVDATALEEAKRPSRCCLLFGNEAKGLEPGLVNACDQNVTLPMPEQIDSLNVANAACVFLYHFTRLC